MAAHPAQTKRRPTAVVMNLFYTGLGIARSLGEQGVPVVGLTAQRGLFGNFTRYAKTVHCADSRNDPETLLAAASGACDRSSESRSVLFPTRDHDLVFLNRFRQELEPHFALVMPSRRALERCLNKWDTYQFAVRCRCPVTEMLARRERRQTSRGLPRNCTYPVVLKPFEAHHWRAGENWNIVGGRKAICRRIARGVAGGVCHGRARRTAGAAAGNDSRRRRLPADCGLLRRRAARVARAASTRRNCSRSPRASARAASSSPWTARSCSSGRPACSGDRLQWRR